MFKRYDLDVFYNSVPIYSGSFSSINILLKVASGFDSNICELDCVDTVMEKNLDIDEMSHIFKNEQNGI